MLDLLTLFARAAPAVAQGCLGDDRDQLGRCFRAIEDRLTAKTPLQRAFAPLGVLGPDLHLRSDIRLGLEQARQDQWHAGADLAGVAFVSGELALLEDVLPIGVAPPCA